MNSAWWHTVPLPAEPLLGLHLVVLIYQVKMLPNDSTIMQIYFPPSLYNKQGRGKSLKPLKYPTPQSLSSIDTGDPYDIILTMGTPSIVSQALALNWKYETLIITLSLRFLLPIGLLFITALKMFQGHLVPPLLKPGSDTFLMTQILGVLIAME